jgi:hypothetical protein
MSKNMNQFKLQVSENKAHRKTFWAKKDEVNE